MKVTVLNKVYEFKEGLSLLEIAQNLKLNDVYAVSVDGRLRELHYQLFKDARLEFLDLNSTDAVRMYQTTLRYIFAMALYKLDPNKKIKFNYSISRSILAVVDDTPVTPIYLDKILKEVDRIIKADYPIVRKSISKEEAVKLYEAYQLEDKIETLEYREEENVNIYQSDGYINYMFGYMLASTGQIKDYKAFVYHPGFLIQYPRAELKGEIPEFIDQPTFGKTLKDAAKWGDIIGGNTIAKVNEYTKTRDLMVDFINLCETKHNNQLTKLGDMILEDIEDIKLIAVAGPSSSGKTTFTNRLRIELLSRGIKPQMISMDDYYLGKEQAPKDEHGKPDLEHVDALDVELFNRDMAALARGEAITLPKFNFKTGIREVGRRLQLAENTPILIEGIHALNDRLTALIPQHQKFKIFIAPQTQMHIDNHNPISITDLRLLRRSVRDQKYRNSPFTITMDMWQSVRRGEFRWIYPYQEGANFVFNSELTYEFAVLKKYALPHLLSIPREDPHFMTANRLVKFLKYFAEIDDDIIPSNSLLKEFIGGSPFHD